MKLMSNPENAMPFASDPTLSKHLDALDWLVEEARRSAFSHGRIQLPRLEMDFLLDVLGNDGSHPLAGLDPLMARTVAFHDHINIAVEDLAALIHQVRVRVQIVSIDEAVQRG
jgi:hypothetical protein